MKAWAVGLLVWLVVVHGANGKNNNGNSRSRDEDDNGRSYDKKAKYFLSNSPVGCEYYPCMNGGTCIELENGKHTCQCPNLYGGRNCEIALNTCTCKGATHCRTFDQANINYHGKCRFLLSRHHGQHPVSVYAHRTPHDLNPHVMYIGGIDLEFEGYQISFTVENNAIEVKVNGIHVELPYKMEGEVSFDIFFITLHAVQFLSNYGFRLDFHRTWYIKVVVPTAFNGSMSGVCGNFDGEMANDYTLQNGTDVNGEEEADMKIGNSYVDDSNKSFEECQLKKAPTPLTCVTKTSFQGQILCAYLRPETGYGYLFRKCLEVFDPVILKKFHDICMHDMLLTCDLQAARDILRAFATACNHNGIKLPEWTETVNEECKCSSQKQKCFRHASGCVETCQSLLSPQPIWKPHGRCILENYNSVCVCPENMVYHDGRCIPAAACGCVDADTGVVYPLRATWLNDDCSIERKCHGNGNYKSKSHACASDKICVAGVCKSCIPGKCKHGECFEFGSTSFCQCTPGYKGESCDEKITKEVDNRKTASCICTTGQQCLTFDGVLLDYLGNCRYLLVNHDNFQVHVSSVFRSNTYNLSYPQSVEVYYKNHVVKLYKDGFSTSAVVRVLVNNISVEIPYESEKGFCIIYNGDYVQVRLDNGVNVAYTNKWRVKVDMPKRFKEKLNGVCGDYNSDPTNDYTTATGQNAIGEKKPGSFVTESFVLNCSDQRPPRPPEEECQKPSPGKCYSILNKEGPFQKCLHHMGQQKVGLFVLSCIKEVTSSCNEMFACESLENFAKSCQEAGASVVGNWRGSFSCPSGCPDPSMSRAMKTTACRGTCANKPCKVVPNVATDICICPAGKVLFDGFCVPNKDCGCVDEKGSARQLDEEWLEESCETRKKCTSGGVVTKKSFKCPKYTYCRGETCSSCSSSSCKNGGQCLDVSVEGKKMCKCHHGFSGSDCSVACNKKMDTVIVIDNTQSQCRGDPTFDGDVCNQWKKVLDYVAKIVNFLQIGSPDNNIALVKLSDTPMLIGRGFVSSQGLVKLLKQTKIAFNFEDANVAAALRFFKKSVFTSSFDRSSAPNHVLFILNSWHSNREQVKEELEALKSLQAKFTAVVTNDKIDETAIKALVSTESSSERSHFIVPSVRAIESTKKYVQNTFNLCAAGHPVTCSCVGAGRCTTFDGLLLKYKGTCSFLMLQHVSDLGRLQVWLRTYNPFPIGNLRYPGRLIILLNGREIILERKFPAIGSLVTLYLNGVERSIPFSEKDFYVFYNGDAVELSTTVGISVSLSKLHYAKVFINPTFKNEVEGFCGNYDGNWRNDMHLADGTPTTAPSSISKVADGTQVGDSWANKNDTEAINGQCSGQEEEPSCRSRFYKCRYITHKRKAFASCYKKYPKEAAIFRKKCEADSRSVCKSDYKPECQVFAEFDRFCQSKGIYANWRSSMRCRCECPPEMQCAVRGSACIPTCSNPNAVKMCLLPDVADTCVCPEGKVVLNQRCVNPSLCGCTDHQGREKAIGETWTTENCTKLHTCVGLRATETTSFSCLLGSQCENEKCVGCKRPMDIVFLLDMSGSVCSGDKNQQIDENGKIIGCGSWTYMLQAVSNLLKDAVIGPSMTQVAMVTFSTTAELSWNLDAYSTKASLINAIMHLKYGRGFTNMAAALRVARTEVFNSPADRPYAENVMIFITDGKATIEVKELPVEAFKVQMMNIKQVAIGITDSIDEMNLKMLSDPPHKLGKNYFRASGFEVIEFLRKQLQKEMGICPDTKHYVCECWGDISCKTFDGKILDYPALCKTSLSFSSSLNYPFNVFFNIHRPNDTKELAYVSYVEIKIGDDVVKIEKVTKLWRGPIIVTLNGEIIEVPFKKKRYNFEYNGNYLQFETDYGLVLGFSDHSNLFLKLPKTLSFNVEGFCGNFDDDEANDILLSNHKYPTDLKTPGVEVGNSFVAEEYSVDPNCQGKLPPLLDCPDHEHKVCNNIVDKNGPFGGCVFLLGEGKTTRFFHQCLNSYKRSCVRDSICRSLEAFVAKCRSSGWKEDATAVWREKLECSCTCDDADKICRPFGPSCLNTCVNQTKEEQCDKPPAYDVCVCKDPSKVLQQGKCVELSECGCIDETGILRKVFESFLDNDCTRNSTCVSANNIESSEFACPGTDQCFNNKCTPCKPVNPCLNEGVCEEMGPSKYVCRCKPKLYGRHCEREHKTGVCRLWPGVGSLTYDRAFLDYDGLDKYLLSSGIFGSESFHVFAKNIRACKEGKDHVTRIRYVEFVYKGYRVHLERDRDNDAAAVLAVVNGVSVSIPYKSPYFSINYVGSFVQVQTFFGLILAFSATSEALVQLPAIGAFTSSVEGLCGNFDGKSRNDYSTSQGTDVYDRANRGAEIVNSYDDSVLFKDDDPVYFENGCSEALPADMEKCKETPDKCDIIKDKEGPFKWCAHQLEKSVLDGFVKTCKRNYLRSCKGNFPALDKSVCDSLTAFVRNCQAMLGWTKESVAPDWNTWVQCPCPVLQRNMSCDSQAVTCLPTCIDPQAATKCNLPVTFNGPACKNKNDVYYKGKCIDPSKCACVDDQKRDRQVGEEWMTSDCSEKVKCVGRDQVQREASQCKNPANCNDGKCQGCGESIKVLFVVHNTLRNCDRDWPYMLQFLADMVKLMRLEESNSKVYLLLAEPRKTTQMTYENLSTKEFIELIKELNCVEGNSQTVFDLVTTLAKVRSTLQQDRTRIPDHVLILTESTSFRLKHLIAGELFRLNTMGVNVVSVGLGDQVKEEAIKAISSPFFVKGKNYFLMDDYAQLGLLRQALQQELKLCPDTRPAKCSCFGDVHCSTFDQLHLSYQGTCKFLLAQSSSVFQGFKVFMKGTSINGVDAKTVVEFLEVHFNNQTIVLKLQDKDKKSPVQAVVNGKRVGIPSTFDGFYIRLNGRYSELVTPFGLVVALSPDWRSYVELPRTYSFYTKGFCGNYDDELDSDSLTSERMQANEESLGKEIGDSYVVKKDTPGCFIEAPEPVACGLQDKWCDFIDDITGPFAECIEQMSEKEVVKFKEECAFELKTTCKSEAACDMLEVFLEACRRRLPRLSLSEDWRSDVQCSCNCLDPSTQTCEPEGPSCIDTCDNMQASSAGNCSLPVAYDVCRCKDTNQVFFQGHCIEKNRCGCKDDRDQSVHEIGSSWLNDDCTERSVCEGNKVILRKAFACPSGTVCHEKKCTACRPNPCKNNGECSDVDGDKYFCKCPQAFTGVNCQTKRQEFMCVCRDGVFCRTFGGETRRFSSNKPWLLAHKAGKFKVVGKAYRKYIEDGEEQDAFFRYVEVTLGVWKVHFEWDASYKGLFSSITTAVFFNDEVTKVQIPYKAEDFSIRWKGRFLRLESKSGVSVSVAHDGVVVVGVKPGVDVSGFCGSLDEVKNKESLGKPGTYFVVPDLVYELSYDQGRKRRPTKDESCSLDTTECSTVLSNRGAFYNCFNRLKSEHIDGLIERCKKKILETCTHTPVCAFAEELAMRCAEVVGVESVKKWRVESGCACHTRPDMTCSPVGPSCINTCSHATAVSSCKDDDILDSYACKNSDHVLSPEGSCVAKDTCGCVDENGKQRNLQQQWLTKNCSMLRQCNTPNTISNHQHSCGKDAKCHSGFCYGCDKPMDVVFLLDESDAVCHSDPSAVAGAFSILTCNNFKDMQGFVVDLIKYFDITAVKVALLKFADQATVVYALDNGLTKEGLINGTLDTLYTGGSRDPVGALRKIRTQLYKAGDDLAPDVLVTVLSKIPKTADYLLNHELFEARVDGIKVIVVGVESDESTKDFLETVAKADNIFNQITLTAKKFSDLSTIGKKLENIIGLCGPKEGVCACVGGHSCTTFDNATTFHSISCPFTLLKSRSKDKELEVILENQEKLGIQKIKIIKGEHTIELLNKHTKKNTIDISVRVDDGEVEVPYKINGLFSIYYNGMGIEVNLLGEGLRVRMGAFGDLSATLKSNRQLDFTGFCGNYDGDALNDHVLADGTPNNLGNAIAHSYEVELDPDHPCLEELDEITSPEECKGPMRKCIDLQKLSFFSECRGLMNPQQRNYHVDTCLKTKCTDRAVCNVVEELVNWCRKMGVEETKLEGWRDKLDCPCQCADKDKKCQEGKSSACLKTCPPVNGNSSACSLGDAWDVCTCAKAGQVLFKGRCVDLDDCGCVSEQDGRSYELNTSWLNDNCTTKISCKPDRSITSQSYKCPDRKQCFKRKCLFCRPNSPCENGGRCVEEEDDYHCKCKNGFSGKNCERKNDLAACWCWAGTDCHTFDGSLRTSVNGISRFLLVSSSNAKCPFKVFLKNYRPCNEIFAVARYVEIQFADHSFRIEKHDPFSPISKISVYVDGYVVALPLTTEQYSLSHKGHSVFFESSCGFQVTFSGPPVHVKIPTYLNSKVTGLCGNFDDNADNDLSVDHSGFSPSDADEPETEESYDFLYDKCSPIPSPNCNNFTDVCEKLKDNKFSLCLKLLEQVTITGFYKSCLVTAKRACVTKQPAEELLCEVQREFAANCRFQLGYETDVTPLFHSSDQCACPSLPESSDLKCQLISKNCQNTCLSPKAQENCLDDQPAYNVLHCANPNHLLFKGECVDKNRCGCVDVNGYAKELGETWLDDTCGFLHQCIAPNNISSEVYNCSSTDVCSQAHCHGCNQAKDVVVLMQISSTICQNDPTFDASSRKCKRFKRLLELVTETLSPLDLTQSSVAMISFADKAKLEFDSPKDQKTLRKELKELIISSKNGANLNKALIELEKILHVHKNRAHLPKHVILITTSVYTGDEEDKAGVSMRLDRLKLVGVNVVSLGALFELPLPKKLIRAYASPPNEVNKNYFYLESFSDEFKVRSGIEENLRICDTRPARCSCFGDVHCSTFDQLHLSYQGACKFLLAQYPLPNADPATYEGLAPFSVYLKGSSLFGLKMLTWADVLEVKVANKTIVIRKLKFSERTRPVVFVDDIQVAVPSTFDGFEVFYYGDYTRLKTSFGLVVGMSRRWRIFLEVPRSYAFSTHGFCGNFDGNKLNDRSFSNGTLYTNRQDMGVKIGDSYLVPQNDMTHCFDHPKLDDIEAACMMSLDRCTLLTDKEGIFGECYNLFKEQIPEKAESFKQNCLYDLTSVCKERSHCSVMEEYVEECRKLTGGSNAVPKNWRNEANCPCECPEKDQKCAALASPCVNSCNNPNAVDTCEGSLVYDQCVCKNKNDVFFQGQCVSKEECGCYDATDGTEHQVNSSWVSEDCLQKSTCLSIGNISRSQFSCPAGTSCYINKCTACQPNPCLNGGECSDASGHKFKCKCPRGFGGERCQNELSTLTCSCVKGTLCETFDGYELLNTRIGKWTLFKVKKVKLSDGVSVDGSSGTKTAGSAIYSEVEVRAMNVKDCDTGELWVQYVEILIGGYVVRLERIQGAKVAPSLATVNGIQVSIPYNSPAFPYIGGLSYKGGKSSNGVQSLFQLSIYGTSTRFTTNFGLTVYFNSLGVVSIHASLDEPLLSTSANVNGYCGNNDGTLLNDVVVAGKSQVVLGEEDEYDWSVGNKLAELYEVDLGDEILGTCSGPPDENQKECALICDQALETRAFKRCFWNLDEHLLKLLHTLCLKRCEVENTCSLLESVASICSFKVPQASFKDWRQETNCSCETGLPELTCKEWGSPCNDDWLTNPLKCIDLPTNDVIFCNSLSRYPGPCGPKDCIDHFGSARLFGEEWLSSDCSEKFRCTNQGGVWKEVFQCPKLTKCQAGFCIGCDSPKDILIMVDESSNICGSKPTTSAWPMILEMITDVIKIVDISKNKTRLGLVKYSTDARVVFDLGQFYTKKALLDSFKSLKCVGGISNIWHALTVARRDIFERFICTGKRGLVPSFLVFVTGGNRPGFDEKYHILNYEIYQLRLLGVRTIVLGLTEDEKYVQMLPLISARPHKENWDYFLVEKLALIEKIQRPFTDSISSCEFQTSTCKCVGNFHCTTFDHAHLSFKSQCPFLLTELKLLGHLMRVIVTNNLDIEGIFSKQVVEVTWNQLTIKLTNEYQSYKPIVGVYVNSVNVEVPYTRSNVTVQYHGSSVEVVLGMDTRVALVGIGLQGTVYVRVPYQLQLEMKGFCGNYDNHEENDYVTASNEDVSSSSNPGALVGASYSIKKDEDLVCEIEGPEPSCEKGLQKCMQLVGKSSSNQFFLPECNEKLPSKTVEFFQRACMQSFGSKCLTTVACKVVAAYVEECRTTRVDERTLSGWRQLFDCPCSCDNSNMVCVSDASSCAPTCPNPSPATFSIIRTTEESRKNNGTCKLPNSRDVCECSKAGQMLFKGRCVDLDECGCVSEQDGRSYELGKTWLSNDCLESFTCEPTHKISKKAYTCPKNMQCNAGVCSVCYPKPPCHNYGKCEELGQGSYKCICRAGFYGRNCEIKTKTCTLHGNGHAKTFDWAALDFKSTCKFLLVSSTDPNNMKYQVYTRYEKRHDFYFVVYMEVVYAGHVVRLQKREVKGRNLLVVAVNGVQVNNLPVREKYFKIFYANRRVVYEAEFGLVVSLTRSWVAEVALTADVQNLVGFCGNFDGSVANDYVTKEQRNVEKEPDRGNLVGLSYVVDDDPERDIGESCEPEKPEKPETNEEADKICSIIKKSECASRLESFIVDQLEIDCASDHVKSCSKDKPQIYCQNIEMFADLCQSIGSPMKDWRKHSDCSCKCLSPAEQCLTSSTSSSCVPTCGDPDAQVKCTFPDTYESCSCGPGNVLHNDQCISVLACACVDNKGLDRKLKETWYDDDCTTKYTCAGPAMVTSEKVDSCPALCKNEL